MRMASPARAMMRSAARAASWSAGQTTRSIEAVMATSRVDRVRGSDAVSVAVCYAGVCHRPRRIDVDPLDALLAALHHDPADEVAWLALADALEEHGRAAEA